MRNGSIVELHLQSRTSEKGEWTDLSIIILPDPKIADAIRLAFAESPGGDR
jgi:hypothetical protein